jgi:alpha-L-fucosidase
MSMFSMSRRAILGGIGAAGALPLVSGAARAASAVPQRLAGFEQAKFGMFIHWGPYSQASVEASWPIMRDAADWHISEKRYVGLAKTFNPVKFDPDALIDAARSAGQRYMVFTTKHHDGFCMFDSSYTDYKVTKSPYGKDIVKMLADACARRDMPLGFYYSPPDLNHPGYRDKTISSVINWNGEPQRPEWANYLDYMELQLTELLTRYGDVFTIWFDGLYHQEKYDGRRFHDLIHRLQPATLINDRIGIPGDFATPEQFVPTGIPTRDVKISNIDTSVQTQFRPGVPAPQDFQPWETCMTINETWAFNANDRKFKSSRDLIRALVEVASKGGNFLLNIGPGPDGTVQPEFRERLAAIGLWTTVNGEAIYGTLYGPVQGQAGYRTTAKGNLVYVHLLDWPQGPLMLAGLGRKVVDVRLLANKRPVPFTASADSATLDLSGITPDPDATVFQVALA